MKVYTVETVSENNGVFCGAILGTFHRLREAKADAGAIIDRLCEADKKRVFVEIKGYETHHKNGLSASVDYSNFENESFEKLGYLPDPVYYAREKSNLYKGA